MTVDPMKIEEFLKLLEDNASDWPEFAGLSQKEKERVASYRMTTGPAIAFRNSEGRLDGVGGISINGVGEAWMVMPRRVQSHPDKEQRPGQFIDLIRDTRAVFQNLCDENKLDKVFGIGKLSTSFLEHLGFEKANNTLIWTRK